MQWGSLVNESKINILEGFWVSFPEELLRQSILEPKEGSKGWSSLTKRITTSTKKFDLGSTRHSLSSI